MKKLFLFCLVMMLAGCASYFKRKECESINWYEHGKKVALRGEWLNSDKMVLDCRKVEAEIQESQLDQGFKAGMQKYCTTEQAYQTGKEGDFFSRDICEGPTINSLLAEHKRGVADYCAKSNGQQAGASGKKYQNICPKNLEAAFLTEYRKGRKRYVTSMIDTRQNEIRDLESKISTNRSSLGYYHGRASALQGEKSGLESQRNFVNAADVGQIAVLDARINSLETEIGTLNSQARGYESTIRDLESQRDTKSKEISDFRAELPSLEE